MTLLSPSEIADLRAVVVSLLTDTCTILRDDPATGRSATTVATGVACAVQPLLSMVTVGVPAGSPESALRYVIRFAVGQDVGAGDIVRLTSWTPTVDFQVVGPRAPRTPQVVMDVEAVRFMGSV